MKKGQRYSGLVREIEFPNKGIVEVKTSGEAGAAGTVSAEGACASEIATVKNALPGQTVSFVVNKKRGGKCEGRLLEVEQRAACEVPEKACPDGGICGGCLYQGFPYEETLKVKEAQIRKLLAPYIKDAVYDGITASPKAEGYRNKMEYTFGDAVKGGELTLGLHKRGSYYDICSTAHCRIADEDFGKIVGYTEAFFREHEIPYYHRQRHDGILRHLLVRKAAKTGELLVALVTASGGGALERSAGTDIVSSENSAQEAKWLLQKNELLEAWKNGLLQICTDGKFTGILHILNDCLADAIRCDEMTILYGQDHFTEELLGLRFQISPFSFFQTNSLGAELLYSRVRDYVSSDGNDGIVYDLYSGTGTIAQLLAPAAKKVIGVEIVEEAVEAARENARGNGLSNCEFIAGDVLKVLDEIGEKPDYIILDPPRDGVHPKALRHILDYGVERMVYISCKPTSLLRDMEMISAAGYRIERWGLTDMFPFTGNIETVVCLSKGDVKSKKIRVEFSLEDIDTDGFKKGATYNAIRDWIKAKYGYRVTNLNIAQVKQKHGIIERENYNKPKSPDSKQPGCPEEKVKAIEDAMRHFQMI